MIKLLKYFSFLATKQWLIQLLGRRACRGFSIIELLVGAGMALSLFLLVASALTWSRGQYRVINQSTDVSQLVLYFQQMAMNMKKSCNAYFQKEDTNSNNRIDGGDQHKVPPILTNLQDGSLNRIELPGIYWVDKNVYASDYLTNGGKKCDPEVDAQVCRLVADQPVELKKVTASLQEYQPIRVTNRLRQPPSQQGAPERQCLSQSSNTPYTVKDVLLSLELALFKPGQSSGQGHSPMQVIKTSLPIVVYEHPAINLNHQFKEHSIMRECRLWRDKSGCPFSLTSGCPRGHVLQSECRPRTGWKDMAPADDNCGTCNGCPVGQVLQTECKVSAEWIDADPAGDRCGVCSGEYQRQYTVDSTSLPLIYIQNRDDHYVYKNVCEPNLRREQQNMGARYQYGGSFSCPLEDEPGEQTADYTGRQIYREDSYTKSVAGFSIRGPRGRICQSKHSDNNWAAKKGEDTPPHRQWGKKDDWFGCFHPNPAIDKKSTLAKRRMESKGRPRYFCFCPVGYTPHVIGGIHRKLDEWRDNGDPIDEEHVGFYQCVSDQYFLGDNNRAIGQGEFPSCPLEYVDSTISNMTACSPDATEHEQRVRIMCPEGT